MIIALSWAVNNVNLNKINRFSAPSFTKREVRLQRKIVLLFVARLIDLESIKAVFFDDQ